MNSSRIRLHLYIIYNDTSLRRTLCCTVRLEEASQANTKLYGTFVYQVLFNPNMYSETQ